MRAVSGSSTVPAPQQNPVTQPFGYSRKHLVGLRHRERHFHHVDAAGHERLGNIDQQFAAGSSHDSHDAGLPHPRQIVVLTHADSCKIDTGPDLRWFFTLARGGGAVNDVSEW